MELEYLRKIGLTSGEIKVYSAVLEIGASSLNKIHEKTGIERRNIYDILNKLIEKGLVSYVIERGKKIFQITHPNKIINFLEEKKKTIEDTEKDIQPKIKDLVKVFNETKTEVRAEVYRGFEAIKTLHDEILEEKECYWIGGNSSVENTRIKHWFAHWMERRAKKKHMMYDLVDYGTYLEGYEPKKMDVHKKKYYKYCQLPKDISSPMVMVIFGNKVAQIIWTAQPFAFVMESKEVREGFMRYFNHFWKDPW